MGQPKTRSLDELRGALEHCYAVTEALCADLSDDDWRAQSLCPEWTVRDVVDHVTSIEAVMAGWWPDDDATPPPFARAGEFLADSTPYLDRRSWMPVGPGVAAELALAEVDLTGPIARQIRAARNLRFTM